MRTGDGLRQMAAPPFPHGHIPNPDHMSDNAIILQQLIDLSRSLGDPARDLAILGEGNTSARIGDANFLVKASGKELRTADESSFVLVSLHRALAVLDGPELSDSGVRSALLDCRTGVTDDTLPSVETFLHAYLLSLPDVLFVGHTHPTAVNAILCSQNSREAVSGRLFPDEIVCCGPAVCYVEYTDPGVPLARHLRTRVEEFIDAHNMPPKVILMENHGFIALGRTPRDVETVTAMYVKTARTLLGTYAFGGPRFLTPENVARIHTRPDEHHRQRMIGQ
jgi:rhamnose utilization protein RhaD (predicted bifunctional aldolase and dehydrogenase)